MKSISNYQYGDVIGFLTFLEKVNTITGTAKFRCVCGKEFITRTRQVAKQITKSCGCKKKEFNTIASTRHKPVEFFDNGIKKLPELNEQKQKDFWSKIGITAQENICWEWQNSGERYGMFRVGKAMYKANRIAYFLFYGVDPNELHVLHSCDNPKCCNPKHLSLGTHWDNMQDMASKGRAYNGKIKEGNNKQNYYNEN